MALFVGQIMTPLVVHEALAQPQVVPLTEAFRADGPAGLVPANGFTGTGTATDPWTLADTTVRAPDRTVLSIEQLSGHLVIDNVTLEGHTGLRLLNVTNATVRNVTVHANGTGVVFADIANLTVTNLTIAANSTGMLAQDTQGVMRLVNISAAADGIVMDGYNGLLFFPWVSANGSGLVVSNTQLGMVGGSFACGGVGIAASSSAIEAENTWISCVLAGVQASRGGPIKLTDGRIHGGADGIIASDTELDVTDVRFRAIRSNGILVDRGSARLEGIDLESRTHGVVARDAALELVDARIRAPDGDGVRLTGGELVESGSTIDGAARAIVLTGANATLADKAPTLLRDVDHGIEARAANIHSVQKVRILDGHGTGTGLSLDGTETPNGLAHVVVEGMATGVALDVGANATFERLDLDDVDQAATVTTLSRLIVDAGAWGRNGSVEAGVDVSQLSALNLTDVTVHAAMGGELVHAQRSFVRLEGVHLRPNTTAGRAAGPVAASPAAINVVDTALAVRNSSFLRPAAGILVSGQGPHAGPLVTPLPAPRATVIDNVTVRDAGGDGVRLTDRAVARIERLQVLHAAFDGAGTALFVEKDSAFTLHKSKLTAGADGVEATGLRWDGLTALPFSDLFPPAPGRPTETDERVVLRDNVIDAGTGLEMTDLSRKFGLQFINNTVRARDVLGELTDVELVLRNSMFEGNTTTADGFRSTWTNTSITEDFRVENTTFKGGLDGLILVDHGRGTRINGSTFLEHDPTSFIDCCARKDARKGHGIFIHGTDRAPGPVIQDNTFRDIHWSSVRVENVTAWVGDNRFETSRTSLGKGFHTIGVLALNAPHIDVINNTMDVSMVGVAFENSHGNILFNTIDGGTAITILGTGNETVTVQDNHIVATGLPHTRFVDLRFKPEFSAVAWRNTMGTIDHNTFPTSDKLHRAAIRIFEGDGGVTATATPTITNNLVHLVEPRWGIDLTDGSPAMGRAYDGANRISGNLFQGPSGRAIDDDHGGYVAPNNRQGVHDDPVGANVVGNAYSSGPFVHCHDWQHTHRLDDGTRVDHAHRDTDIPCHEDGSLLVASHDFAPGPAPDPGARDENDPPGPTPEPTRNRLIRTGHTTTRDRLECRGFVLGPVRLDVQDLEGDSATLVGNFRLIERGPRDKPLCDDKDDVKITILVDGEIVARNTKRFVFEAPGPGLYHVEVRVEFDSRPHGLRFGHDADKVLIGNAPVIEELRSDKGTLFVKGATVPGGVTLSATVHWPGGGGPLSGDHVVFTLPGGRTQKAYGPNPSIRIDPGQEWAELEGDLVTTATVRAQAIWTFSNKASDPAVITFKLVPIPTWILHFAKASETKVELKPPVGPHDRVNVVWSWDVQLIEEEIEAPSLLRAIGGDYEGKVVLGVVFAVESRGLGVVGSKGGVEFEADSDFLVGKLDGSLELNGTVHIDDIELVALGFTFQINGKLGGKAKLVKVVPPLAVVSSWPLVGDLVDIIELSAGVVVGATIEGDAVSRPDETCASIPDWSCAGTVRFKPGIFAGAKLGWKETFLRGELIGRLVLTGAIPGTTDYFEFKGTNIQLTALAQAKVHMLYDRTWTEVYNSERRSPAKGMIVSEDTGWVLSERASDRSPALVATDSVLVSNLTALAAPALAVDDDVALVAWTHDDLTKPYPRSTDIHAATRDANGSWTPIGALTNDTLADWAPSAAPMGDGRFLVAWVHDTNTTLAPGNASLATAGGSLEVRAAVVDAANGTVLGPFQLSNDAVRDGLPQAIGDGNGTGFVVWRTANTTSIDPAVDVLEDVVVVPFNATGPVSARRTLWADRSTQPWQAATDGERIWSASIGPGGDVVIESNDLDGNRSATVVGNASGVAPALDLIIANGSIHAVWAESTPNATVNGTGNATGNATGNVTGNATGNVTGNATGVAFNATLVGASLPLAGPPWNVIDHVRALAPVSQYQDVRVARGAANASGLAVVWAELDDNLTALRTVPLPPLAPINATAATNASTNGTGVITLDRLRGRVSIAEVEAGHTGPVAWTVQTDLRQRLRNVTYDGVDLENATKTLNGTFEVPFLDAGTTDLVAVQLSEPNGTDAAAPTPDTTSTEADPGAEPLAPAPLLAADGIRVETIGNGPAQVHALLRNDANVSAPPRTLTAGVRPLGADADVVTVDVMTPFVPANASRVMTFGVPVPANATGRWTVQLSGAGLEPGIAGLLLLKPQWRLEADSVNRTGAIIAVNVTNDGPRSGTVDLTVLPFGAQAGSAEPVARADVTVPAGGTTRVELTLPARHADLPVLVAVNRPAPGKQIDQGGLDATTLAVEGIEPLHGLLGWDRVPEGPTLVELDLRGRPGLDDQLVAATLDGAPLTGLAPGTLDDGRVRVNLTLTPGRHVLNLTVQDLLGEPVTLRYVMEAVTVPVPAPTTMQRPTLVGGDGAPTVQARLLADGQPIRGAVVRLGVSQLHANGSRTAVGAGEPATDTNGTASLALAEPLGPGRFRLTATFDGNDTLLASNATTVHAVSRATPRNTTGNQTAAYEARISMDGSDQDRTVLFPPESPVAEIHLRGNATPGAVNGTGTANVSVAVYNGTPPEAPPTVPANATLLGLGLSIELSDGQDGDGPPATNATASFELVIRVNASLLAGRPVDELRLLHGRDTDADGTFDTWDIVAPDTVVIQGTVVEATFRLADLSPFALATVAPPGPVPPRPPAGGGGGGGGGGPGTGHGAGTSMTVLGSSRPGLAQGVARAVTPSRAGAVSAFEAHVATGTGPDAIEVVLPPSSPVQRITVSVAGGSSAPTTTTVRVHVWDGLPVALQELPAAAIDPTRAVFVDVEVDGIGVLGGHLELHLPADRWAGLDPAAVYVVHWDGTVWESLGTTVEPLDAQRILVIAATSGFSPFVVLADESPPIITPLAPVPGASLHGPELRVSASWRDDRGIVPGTGKVLLNGRSFAIVAHEAGFDVDLSAALGEPLAPGEHELVVTVEDESGLTGTHTWTFHMDGPAADGIGTRSTEGAAEGTAPAPVDSSAEDPPNAPGEGPDGWIAGTLAWTLLAVAAASLTVAMAALTVKRRRGRG